MKPLQDGFNRTITNLRISVTDRCNLRCTYCMPENPTWLDRKEILTYEEIARIVKVTASLGITDYRITGGEPTARRNLHEMVSMLSAIPGVKDMAMTTNGLLLDRQAGALRDAGLHRVNISLDTLSGEKYVHITRRPGYEKVWDGIRAAQAVGFRPIKINIVVMKGINDDEILDMARLSRDNEFQVRFIEFMPLDGDRNWSRDKVVPSQEILARIHAEFPLEQAGHGPLTDPARIFRFADGKGDIGVIASVTEPFCFACDRVRITPEGQLRTCLFSHWETDLKTPLRDGASEDELETIIRAAVAKKEAGHGINDPEFVQPKRVMYSIGG